MKKIILACALACPLVLSAQINFQQFVAQLPAMPTAEQIAAQSPTVEAQARYEKLNNDLLAAHQRNITQLDQAQRAMAAQLQKQPKPTAQQQQAMQAVSGDMMAMLAQSGIPMEKLATMSDEEIMAVLAPMMAQKMGLTEQELIALQGMSDKQAEAYIIGNADRKARAQNSEYAQKYGQTVQGMPQGGAQISDAESAIIDQIAKIEDRRVAMNEAFTRQTEKIAMMPAALKAVEKAFPFENSNYEQRVAQIQEELNARLRKDNTIGAGEMASYEPAYLERMNAVINEYNVELAKRYTAKLQPLVDETKRNMDASLKLYNEALALYNKLGATAKAAAASKMINLSPFSAINDHVNVLQKRLEVPVEGRYGY